MFVVLNSSQAVCNHGGFSSSSPQKNAAIIIVAAAVMLCRIDLLFSVRAIMSETATTTTQLQELVKTKPKSIFKQKDKDLNQNVANSIATTSCTSGAIAEAM